MRITLFRSSFFYTNTLPGNLFFRFRYDRCRSFHRHIHGNIFVLIMERLIQLDRSFRRISLRLCHRCFVFPGNLFFIGRILLTFILRWNLRHGVFVLRKIFRIFRFRAYRLFLLRKTVCRVDMLQHLHFPADQTAILVITVCIVLMQDNFFFPADQILFLVIAVCCVGMRFDLRQGAPQRPRLVVTHLAVFVHCKIRIAALIITVFVTARIRMTVKFQIFLSRRRCRKNLGTGRTEHNHDHQTADCSLPAFPPAACLQMIRRPPQYLPFHNATSNLSLIYSGLIPHSFLHSNGFKIRLLFPKRVY